MHGDDFTFCGLDEDLKWIRGLMEEWFDIKMRGVLGPEAKDDKEMVILGRLVKWTEEGIEYQADPKHRKLILDNVGLGWGGPKSLSSIGRVEISELHSVPLGLRRRRWRH